MSELLQWVISAAACEAKREVKRPRQCLLWLSVFGTAGSLGFMWQTDAQHSLSAFSTPPRARMLGKSYGVNIHE